MISFSLRKVCYGLLLLAMASCYENEYIDEETNVAFKADIETPEIVLDCVESRTFIDEDEEAYDSGVGVMWRTKEVVGVYGTSWGQEKKNVKFTSTNSQDDGVVTFSGSLFSNVTPKYAYYPYSEANNGVSSAAVKLSMPIYREYHSTYKDLVADFRAGKLESRNWRETIFTFNRVVTLYRFKVNVSGTPLVGSNIRSISVKVNNQRKISGDFTLDLADQEIDLGNFVEGNDSMTLKWSTEPTLKDGETVMGYATAIPTVKKGDQLTFTLTTTSHKATFTATSKADQVANKMYAFGINLAQMANVKYEELEQYVEPEQPEAVPVQDMKISSFKFEIAKNTGKILPGKVVGNSSTYKPSYNASYYGDAVSCTIDEENKKIKLYLPYLNNRKLVPTFEITEGTTLVCEAGEIISGETEVDFSQFKQVAIVNSIGEGVIYDVELTNSGLPVVVINQGTSVTSTESDSEYSKASAAWYAATKTQWVPKDGPWTVDEDKDGDISRDNFMVYNADGTPAITDKNGAILSEPIFSGTRLRGNVTQQMPKKSFAVKLDKKSGVLDMKPHKRWVLLANWKDRTLMRNAVAFGIAKKFKEVFPNDGLAWTPSGQHVELVYNGVHVGNYYLCEQIKIDCNRLDINDPYDAEDAYSGNPEDYGYLLECDDAYDETWNFTTANYIPFLFKDDANQEMLDYATTFVRGIEDKLYAGNYTEAYMSMDLTSMVDFLLIQELMMNSEMKHPKSCYTYINDGKFYAGPIWDFDWNTLPTSPSNSEEGYSYTASMLSKAKCYHKSSGYPTEPIASSWSSDANYMWYPMLVKDATFKNLAAERWNAVKGALQTFVSVEIPQIQAKIAESDKVNNEMWPITVSSWGNTFDMGGGKCGDESYDFSKAISTLQSTLNTRINGMSYVSNTNWPSKSYTTKN